VLFGYSKKPGRLQQYIGLRRIATAVCQHPAFPRSHVLSASSDDENDAQDRRGTTETAKKSLLENCKSGGHNL